jgi:hypothetical protein
MQPQESVIYASAKHPLDECFTVLPNSIELPSIHDVHRNSILHTSNSDSRDTDAGSQDACLPAELASVRRSISVSQLLDNYWASKPISNDYLHILKDEIHL